MSKLSEASKQQILNFEFDRQPVVRPFQVRLAQEEGWDERFAERAIHEYKRFIVLAASGTASATPSEIVDKVWHLHLTCTRSYWEQLCGEILERPLHHEPGTGAPGDDEKHARQYLNTLNEYRNAFGKEAPYDIWPRPGMALSLPRAANSGAFSFRDTVLTVVWVVLSSGSYYVAKDLVWGQAELVIIVACASVFFGAVLLYLRGLKLGTSARTSTGSAGAWYGCGSGAMYVGDPSHHSDSHRHMGGADAVVTDSCADSGGVDSGASSGGGSSCGASCGGGCGSS